MTPEQIVRDTLAAIDAHDLMKAAAYTADTLTVTDAALNLPRPMDKAAFFAQMSAILQAFPDWKYTIHTLTTQADRVTVAVNALATNTQPLQLPGLPALPATGKRVNVPDQFIFIVKDDYITAIAIDSPPQGGAAEMLRQLGITLPSRSG